MKGKKITSVQMFRKKNTRTFLDEDGNEVKKKKGKMRMYTFEVCEEQLRVCKKFFKTLDISEAIVHQVVIFMEDMSEEGIRPQIRQVKIALKKLEMILNPSLQ